jgi:hypothetical protein
MAVFTGSGTLLAMFDVLLSSGAHVPTTGVSAPQQSAPEPGINPFPIARPRKRTVKERLKETHVLEQLLKLTLAQSVAVE